MTNKKLINETVEIVVENLNSQMMLFGVERVTELPSRYYDKYSLGYIVGMLWIVLKTYGIDDIDNLKLAIKKAFKKIFGIQAFFLRREVNRSMLDDDMIFNSGRNKGLSEMNKFINGDVRIISGWISYAKNIK